jgi:hypothetical protein
MRTQAFPGLVLAFLVGCASGGTTRRTAMPPAAAQSARPAATGDASTIALAPPVNGTSVTESVVRGGAELTLAGKISGTATMTHGGVTRALQVDDRIPGGATITTAPGALAVLVFSNATTLQLGADTSLVIERYLQAVFAGTVSMARVIEEPSISQLHVRLERGEIVGNVKQLNVGRGSSFRLETPVGGVNLPDGHGVFRASIRSPASGEAVFQLSAARGTAALISANDGAKVVRVPEGQEISIHVNVATGDDGRPVVTVH